jgi:hypothetical protein
MLFKIHFYINFVSYSFFFYYHIIIVPGVRFDIYKSAYNTSQWNSPPPSFSFILLPHSWNSFNRSHFSIYAHMCTQYLHRIHPLYPFLISSHPLWYQSPGRTYFTFLSFIFDKRHFCLFKIVTQEVSL